MGLVEQSGGVSGLCSPPGHGTVFMVFLPSDRSSVMPIRSLKTVGNTCGNETMLLVEDDMVLLDMI